MTVGLSGASASPRQPGRLESPPRSLAAQAAPTLILTTPSGPQTPNHTIDIELSITGGSALAAFEFALEYDRALVQLTGITPGAFLGATAGCNPGASRCAVALGPLEQSGATAVGGYSYGTGPGANGDGVLAVLHLQPTGAEGTATLHIAGALIVDIAGSPSTPATQDATLVLAAPIVTPTPTQPRLLKLYLPVMRR